MFVITHAALQGKLKLMLIVKCQTWTQLLWGYPKPNQTHLEKVKLAEEPWAAATEKY